MSEENSEAPSIQVFRPTYEEFKDFNKYIAFIESQGAHEAGIAKIIPPPEWNPRKNGYNLNKLRLKIPSPLNQKFTGTEGIYQQRNIPKKSTKVQDYMKSAQSEKYKTPDHSNYEELERKYWETVTQNSPLYGADVKGSLMDEELKEWNLRNLGSILDSDDDCEVIFEGVNTPYLYFGMWKTTVAWHVQDMDLYCINFLHSGDATTWYAIPPIGRPSFERFVNDTFLANHQSCPSFLRHKMTLISPEVLTQNFIPWEKIVQQPGEIIIAFPDSYVSFFNHGFNVAESTNFATPRWVGYGMKATYCSCVANVVKIPMGNFIRRHLPDRYDAWVLEQQAAQLKVKQELMDSPDACPEMNFEWNLSEIKNLPQQDFEPFVQSTGGGKKRRGRPKKVLSSHEPTAKLSEPEKSFDSFNPLSTDDVLPPEQQANSGLDCPQLTKETSDSEARQSTRIKMRKFLKRKEQDMPVLQPMKKLKLDDFGNDEVPSSDTDSDSFNFSYNATTSDIFKSIPTEDITRMMNCHVVLNPLSEQTLESLSKPKKNDSNDSTSTPEITDKLSILSSINKGLHKFVKECNRRKGLKSTEPFDSTMLDSLNQEPETICKKEENELEIFSGDEVWARYHNTKFYPAKVVYTENVVFYKVSLKNTNTFCPHFYPSDVLNYPVNQVPEIGADLELRWMDKKIYDGVFLGLRRFLVYKVVFDHCPHDIVSLSQMDLLKKNNAFQAVKVSRQKFVKPKDEPEDNDEQPLVENSQRERSSSVSSAETCETETSSESDANLQSTAAFEDFDQGAASDDLLNQSSVDAFSTPQLESSFEIPNQL